MSASLSQCTVPRQSNASAVVKRRMCQNCQGWTHLDDSHRLCYKCNGCSPLDSCLVCAQWDLQRWKTVSAVASMPSSEGQKRRHSLGIPTPPPKLQRMAPRPPPAATVTSATAPWSDGRSSSSVTQSTGIRQWDATPPPAGRDWGPGRVYFPLAPFWGNEGQWCDWGHDRRVDETSEWESSEADGAREGEREGESEVASGGEKAILRRLVESAWPSVLQYLPGDSLDSRVAPRVNPRVWSSCVRPSAAYDPKVGACSIKMRQYKEAYDGLLSSKQSPSTGIPQVRAVYPVDLSLIHDTPLSFRTERAPPSDQVADFLRKQRTVSLSYKDFAALGAAVDDLMAALSYSEVCLSAISNMPFAEQTLQSWYCMFGGVQACSSAAFMLAMRTSTRLSALYRDSLLSSSRFSPELQASLRRVPLSADGSPFGQELFDIVAKARQTSAPSRQRSSQWPFRRPRATPQGSGRPRASTSQSRPAAAEPSTSTTAYVPRPVYRPTSSRRGRGRGKKY